MLCLHAERLHLQRSAPREIPAVGCTPGKVMLSGPLLPKHENRLRLTDLLGLERQGYAFQAAKICFKAQLQKMCLD